MAQLKAASGGDAPAGFHEVGTVLRGGVTGTYEVWADLHALRSAGTHTLGNKRYEEVEGAWIPFVLSQTEGEHHFTQTVTSLTFGPIPPERFAPPAH